MGGEESKLAELTEAKRQRKQSQRQQRWHGKLQLPQRRQGKQQAEGPVEDEGASKKTKTQEEGDEDMDKVARVACRKCMSF